MAAQRGVYTCSFVEVTITAAGGNYGLYEVAPADDRPVEVIALFLGVKSEVGDAQDEMLTIAVVRGHVTSMAGSAITARPLDPRDGPASFGASTTSTSIGTGGTPITMAVDAFNVRAGLQWIFPDYMRPKADQGDTNLHVHLISGVADDLTMSGTLWLREL